MRTDTELLDWLAEKVHGIKVFIKGVGWTFLDRASLNEAMDKEQ
jgi:hypothetical protein